MQHWLSFFSFVKEIAWHRIYIELLCWSSEPAVRLQCLYWLRSCTFSAVRWTRTCSTACIRQHLHRKTSGLWMKHRTHCPCQMKGLKNLVSIPLTKSLTLFINKHLYVIMNGVRAKSLQSCLTLWDSTDYSPPGSSVHGILQARTLQWVSMPSSRGSSQPRDQTHISDVSCIGRQVLYH